jgi:hypothetical protein
MSRTQRVGDRHRYRDSGLERHALLLSVLRRHDQVLADGEYERPSGGFDGAQRLAVIDIVEVQPPRGAGFEVGVESDAQSEGGGRLLEQSLGVAVQVEGLGPRRWLQLGRRPHAAQFGQVLFRNRSGKAGRRLGFGRLLGLGGHQRGLASGVRGRHRVRFQSRPDLEGLRAGAVLRVRRVLGSGLGIKEIRLYDLARTLGLASLAIKVGGRRLRSQQRRSRGETDRHNSAQRHSMS